MLPVNGALPRHARSSPPQDPSKNKWQGCYVVSLTLFASAILATLVTFGVLNFLLNGVTLPPVSTETGLLHSMQQQDPQLQMDTADTGGIHPPQLATEEGTADASTADAPVHAPNIKPPPAVMKHPFDDLQKLYTIPEQDSSPRCKSSQICDGDHSCGPDKLGCVTSAEERKAHVRKAIAWAWEGYRYVVEYRGSHLYGLCPMAYSCMHCTLMSSCKQRPVQYGAWLPASTATLGHSYVCPCVMHVCCCVQEVCLGP